MERARYQSELSRLATYANYPNELEGPPIAAAFARNGFIHIGNGRTQCFSCSGTIDNWNKYDDVRARHEQLCEDCEMVLGTSTVNVLMQGAQASTTLEADSVQYQVRSERVNDPTADDYRSESVRVRSYVNWPKPHIDARELAKAGFYYTGRVDDVACRFCSQVIGNWSRTDDPAREHRRLSPHCPFMLGRDVGNVPLRPVLDDSISSTDSSPDSSLGWISSEEGNQAQDPGERREEDAMISKVVEMGFSEEFVRGIYYQQAGGYASVDDFMEEVLRLELNAPATVGTCAAGHIESQQSSVRTASLEADSAAYVRQESARPRTHSEQLKILQAKIFKLKLRRRIDKKTERVLMKKVQGNELQSEADRRGFQHELNLALASSADANSQIVSLKRQLLQLEQHMPQCVICMDAERDTVLQPCGHFVVCETCGCELLGDDEPTCPICRKQIISTQKVYL